VTSQGSVYTSTDLKSPSVNIRIHQRESFTVHEPRDIGIAFHGEQTRRRCVPQNEELMGAEKYADTIALPESIIHTTNAYSPVFGREERTPASPLL
jgi:hypothetical protein